MQVKTRERVLLQAQAQAEPADNVVTRDYYASLPQIRLTGVASGNPTHPNEAVEIILDGNDLARLVECALRHPQPNMRYGVLAAIWNHADSFRQIFAFGLRAPEAFPDVRRIVAEELKTPPASQGAAAKEPDSETAPLLPRMPPPAHLGGRTRDRPVAEDGAATLDPRQGQAARQRSATGQK